MKPLNAAAWIYGVVFIGSMVGMVGLVAYCAITGDVPTFGEGH